MKKILFLFLLSFIVRFSVAQTETDFPASWQGNWSGELKIYKAAKVVQTVPMTLEIKRIDSVRYTFAMVYGTDREKGLRPYELVVKNPEKGEYMVDEKNSIQMNEYLFDNKLFCWFSVEGNQLLSSYEKKGNTIIFEIISGKNQPISTTGGQKVNGEDIPPVQSFPVAVMQRAVLTKIVSSETRKPCLPK